MALLKHMQTARTQTLCHHAQIGRAPDAELHIDNPRVSTQHASVRWVGTGWELKDLGSHNGTAIDGHHIESGVWTPIDCGVAICFGAPQERWTLETADAPEVSATRLDTGEVLIGEHGYLKFSPLDSEASLATADGQQYFLDSGGVRVQVEDRAVVDVGEVRVRLSLPPGNAPGAFTLSTEDTFFRGSASLHFEVSADEEHVAISITHGGEQTALKSRSFDYMLLQLARARIEADRNATQPDAERGWIYADDLAKALGVGLQHLNVDVYRARRRFEEVGVEGAATIIERRPALKLIRLGISKLSIAPQ